MDSGPQSEAGHYWYFLKVEGTSAEFQEYFF